MLVVISGQYIDFKLHISEQSCEWCIIIMPGSVIQMKKFG